MRKIQITFERTGERATAVLLDDLAPRTCEAMWQAIEQPLVTTGIHAGWAGRMVSVEVPEVNRVFDAASLPRENLTVLPIPGDICFGYFPPGYGFGITDAYWDMALVYGRETRFEFSFGPVPMTVWATVDEGLDELAAGCGRTRTEGLQTIRVGRSG